VSIKKKFATAVATASLLAGIFGSAFVPSALAARGDVDDPIARYTVITSGTDILTNAGGYDADGVELIASKYGFYSAVADDSDTTNNATISVELFSSFALNVETGLREGGDNVVVADLIAQSGSSKLRVAWSAPEACVAMETGEADFFGQTDSVEDVAEATGVYTLCLAADTDTSAVSTTVTIKARAGDSTGAYVTVATLPVQVLGDLASLTASITDGYRYIANDNNPVAAWLTIVGKDSAGNLLNGGNNTITQDVSLDAYNIVDWDGNPDNWEEIAVSVLVLDGGAAVGEALDEDANDADFVFQGYSIGAAVCVSNDDLEESGDEGSSYTVKFEGNGGDVVSNGVTITCTDNDARVTKLTPEATSGDMEYEEAAPGDSLLDIDATVVDGAGRPFGDGSNVAACNDFTWTFDGDEDLNAPAGVPEAVAFGTDVVAGGICEVTNLDIHVTRMGRFTYTLEAATPDLGDDDADEVTFTLRYVATGSDDVTISRTRNAAKTRATISADMGEDNAYLRVEFFVELANGNLKTYTRRANDAGVAVLIQSRRNTTIYVFADLAGEDEAGSPTDVLKVKFK
jgi:hypothetical protein